MTLVFLKVPIELITMGSRDSKIFINRNTHTSRTQVSSMARQLTIKSTLRTKQRFRSLIVMPNFDQILLGLMAQLPTKINIGVKKGRRTGQENIMLTRLMTCLSMIIPPMETIIRNTMQRLRDLKDVAMLGMLEVLEGLMAIPVTTMYLCADDSSTKVSRLEGNADV